MEAILMLLLGWVLGLISPSITSAIQERKKAIKIKQSILNELDEFQITMASLIYKIESHFNTLDHEMIDFILPIYKKYSGIKSIQNTLKGLEEFKKLSLEQLNLLQIQSNDSYTSLSLRRYDLPFLKTKTNELLLLENDFQRKALELLFLLDIFNEKVDESRFFYKLTFDGSVSEENHLIVSEEIERSYKNISQQAKLILQKINSILDINKQQ